MTDRSFNCFVSELLTYWIVGFLLFFDFAGITQASSADGVTQEISSLRKTETFETFYN